MAAFLPALLGGLTKVAGGQAMGQVTKQAIGGAVKDFAAGKVKGALGGRGRRVGGGGGQGQGPGRMIVQTGGGRSSIVPSRGGGLVVAPSTPAKAKDKVIPKVSYESLSKQLNSITGKLVAIESATEKGIKQKQTQANKSRVEAQKEKSREKEDRLSKFGLAAEFVGGQAKNIADQLGILNFINNVLMGIFALKLLPLIPKIIEGLEFLGDSLHGMWLGFKGITLALETIGPAIRKGTNRALVSFSKRAQRVNQSFRTIGKGISKSFQALGKKVIPGIVRTGLSTVRNATQAARTFGGNTLRRIAAIGGVPNSQLGASSKALQQLTRTAQGGASSGIAVAQGAMRIRKLHGDTAAMMFKGLVENGMSPAKAMKYVMKQLKAGKVVSAPLKGSLGAGLKGSTIFKGGVTNVARRGVLKLLGPKVFKALTAGLKKIPIIGPLIVGVVSLLSGEPAAQALFKAGGALLGGFLGTFIPIPIVGTLVGELIGEYIGDLMYTATMGGGVDALGQKLKKDIQGLLTFGTAAMDWIGAGFQKFYKGIPKIKIKIIGVEIPNPVWMLNPLNIAEKVSLFGKSFFTKDPVNEERAQEIDNESNVSPPDDYQPPASSSAQPTTPLMGQSTLEGNRPGSDALADHVSIAPASSNSKVPFNATGGNRERRIFLHWSAGDYNQAYDSYHTIFLGNGQAVRNTPYGQDKNSHTAGGNTGSIGLSIAAMKGGQENASSWPTPPTQAQIDAMTSEAARIALEWGMSPSDIDRMVMTHGEWERYATRNGILSAPAQRWDLDKLRPSDPNIDTRKIKSSGGNQLRAMIKAKMQSLGNESNQLQTSTQAPAQTAPQQSLIGSRPTELATPEGVSPSNFRMFESMSEEKLDQIMSAQPGDTLIDGTMVTPQLQSELTNYYDFMTRQAPPSIPTLPSSRGSQDAQFGPQSSPSDSAIGIQQQASYDQRGGGTTNVVPIPTQGPTSRMPANKSAKSLVMGSGDVLNSYYKAQLMGFLYKFG